MTWVTQQGHANLFAATHYTYGGDHWEGPARWWMRLRGAEKVEEKCMPWPDPYSEEHIALTDFAVANAALLGAEFQYQNDQGWSDALLPHLTGYHTHKADAAQAFLSLHRYWCAYNHRTKQWELVRQ